MRDKELFKVLKHFLTFRWFLDASVIDHRVCLSETFLAFKLLEFLNRKIDIC